MKKKLHQYYQKLQAIDHQFWANSRETGAGNRGKWVSLRRCTSSLWREVEWGCWGGLEMRLDRREDLEVPWANCLRQTCQILVGLCFSSSYLWLSFECLLSSKAARKRWAYQFSFFQKPSSRGLSSKQKWWFRGFPAGSLFHRFKLIYKTAAELDL